MVEKYFKKVRSESWRLIAREYPEEKDKYSIVNSLLMQSVSDKCTILDAGCGHRSEAVTTPRKSRIIGIDLCRDHIRRNENLAIGLQASISAMPITSNSVDVIVCNMVLEHLQRPEATVSEFGRVLKTGGWLIIMTPCIYNIVTVISRIIPNRFHTALASLLTGADEDDVFPTYYKANSPYLVRRMLAGHRLIEHDLVMYQPPPFAFVFSKTLCRAVIAYYRLINRYKLLQALRGVIIARYQKV